MHPDLGKVVSLVGPPNAGKTTLYNWITGSSSKTVNYPGATVDYSTGTSLSRYGPSIEIIDTPGTYSLFPKTPEEIVTEEILFAQTLPVSPSLLIVVVDATQFVRQIALACQLQQSGWPIIIALTMADIVKEDGGTVDVVALAETIDAPVVAIDGRLGGGVLELMEKVHQLLPLTPAPEPHKITPWTAREFQNHQKVWKKIETKTFSSSTKHLSQERTRKIDSLLLNPFTGIFIFFGIMILLFSSIFWLAAPFMDWIDLGFSVLADLIQNQVTNTLVAGFLSNGIIAGFGALFIFIPQIFILFFGLNLLEDSGYLSRAATLVDKPLSFIGLNGRSFVPLLAGHACAVPAMMATRTIPNKRERWLTLTILPLMTCSARLPVYALLLSFLFDSTFTAGIWLAIIYFSSFIIGGVTSSIVSRFLPNNHSSFFLLELPDYRRPSLVTVLKATLDRTKSFVFKAGPVIFVLSIVIWGLTTFPAYHEKDNHQRIVQSYAAQLGQVIEPAMKPIGLDWKSGIGIITSIAAREVFVSTMAMIYNVADESDEGLQSSLKNAMKKATHQDGSPVFTTASVAALIVFYMIALQCIATVSIARREANSWLFAITQLIAFNVLAYLSAFSIYTLLS